mmetsp:Transcript_19117/g.47544  ORF Transcript_19117/g.47544 Transcript_19117/m.47544 type:complete len:220 (-) Transcript_19117:1059-1718(-)
MATLGLSTPSLRATSMSRTCWANSFPSSIRSFFCSLSRVTSVCSMLDSLRHACASSMASSTRDCNSFWFLIANSYSFRWRNKMGAFDSTSATRRAARISAFLRRMISASRASSACAMRPYSSVRLTFSSFTLGGSALYVVVVAAGPSIASKPSSACLRRLLASSSSFCTKTSLFSYSWVFSFKSRFEVSLSSCSRSCHRAMSSLSASPAKVFMTCICRA